MYNLTAILLNGNQIHSIDQYTFCRDSLPMLHFVNLVDALTNIPEGIFSTPEEEYNAVYKCDLTNLNFLRLSAVRTNASHFEGILQPFVFSRFRGMNEPLQMCGVGVTGISNDTFACLTEVRTLLLTDNKIQNLRLQAFSHLTSLQQLLLNNNSLSSMSAISEPHPNLVDLNASNNMIERLDGSFSVLRRVTCFDFSHNRIDHVQNNTFSFCLKLERLYLQYNRIRWIDDGAFQSVSSLRILNLAHNRLFYVHQYLFADMYSLCCYGHMDYIYYFSLCGQYTALLCA